jgi:iron complex transport system substrate-binding protein
MQSMKKTFLIIFLIALTIVACQQDIPKKGIVVISPELAEIIVNIAGDGQIIGVAEECDYPQILQYKEKVGNFGQINLEKIVSLRPEYVITSSLEQEAISKDLEKMGIKVVTLYPKNVNEMLNTITELGKITKAEKNADALVEKLNKELSELKEFVPTAPKKVFVEIYNDPIMSVSNDSYVGDLLSIAGGINIFPTLERDYCRVKNEDIINANPDIIIITYPDMTKEMIKSRKGWEHINAVKNNRIYTIDEVNPDLILRATPRNIEGIIQLRNAIYE